MNDDSTPVRGVLFDLDGTLIDHFDTLHRCYRETFEHLGLPPPDAATVRRAVGGSMEITMARLVDDAALRADAAAFWRSRFDAIHLDDVKLMPGALWILERLHARGLALGVFTNKIGEHSRGICRHLGMEPFLRCVLGANDTPFRKPQREFTAHALDALGAGASETVLVGDSPYDIDAARAGNLRALCVTTGTHSEAELREAGADAVHPDLFALGELEFALERSR